MSTVAEDIARRLAERLAPLTGEDLPARVERVLAEGEPLEAPTRSLDPALALQYASFVVSLASVAWTIFSAERARLEQQAAAARAAEQEAKHEALVVEAAYLRGLIEGRLGGEVDVPQALPEKLRIAAVEAAADEAVEAGKRERHRVR